MIDREDWQEEILTDCLKRGICNPYVNNKWCEMIPGNILRCTYHACPRLQEMEEARQRMHVSAMSFLEMLERNSLNHTLSNIDAGTQFVKKKYHDDNLRRDVK